MSEESTHRGTPSTEKSAQATRKPGVPSRQEMYQKLKERSLQLQRAGQPNEGNTEQRQCSGGLQIIDSETQHRCPRCLLTFSMVNPKPTVVLCPNCLWIIKDNRGK